MTGDAPTGAALLAGAVRKLRAAGVADPGGDARRLLAWALGRSAAGLATELHDHADPSVAARYGTALTARCARQPVSQITGHRAFWGRDFIVTPDVLDPRPDSETLIAEALREGPTATVLDLGTGSGCLLLTLLAEWPEARGTGTDISAAALDVGRRNAATLRVEGRVQLMPSDWWQGVEGRFDLIVANPPYIAAGEMPGLSPEVRLWEPHQALSPGETGLEAYAVILSGIAVHMAAGGRALLEIGADQGQDVARLAGQAGLTMVRVLQDLNGRDRVVAAHGPRP